MIKIIDKLHNRIYYFTLCKVLEDITQDGVSIYDKNSKRTPYIPTSVIKELKNL